MLELVRNVTEPPLAPPVPQPAESDLDEPHRALWEAVCHLFPRNAHATQADHASLVISWRMRNPQRGGTHFAAPIVIRLHAGLLLALWTCHADDRRLIAELQADTVMEALAGYDPHSRINTCGVIELGDG